MRSLVELLGIKGGAEAEGDAWAEEDVVGESCNTAVVDLDLYHHITYQKAVSYHTPTCMQGVAYLGERDRVQSVLASNLKPDRVPALRVP